MPVSTPTHPSHQVDTADADRTHRMSVPVRLAVALIAAYQALLRPFLLGACKYCPSCSEYAAEALRTHGLLRGGKIALGRLARCHPFGPGGYDPVPGRDRPTS